MGVIASVLNKRGENVAPLILSMLRELAHRSGENLEIVTPAQVMMFRLGHNLTIPRFASYLAAAQSCPKLTSEKQQSTLKNGFDGSRTFASVSFNEIHAGRDTLGINPLYYGEDETMCAVASERKALWKLGLRNVKAFPPGYTAKISRKGFAFKAKAVLNPPHIKAHSMESAARSLQKLLLESTSKHIEKAKPVGVAFSGGLDSSIVALLVKECSHGEARLVSVGLRGQPETKHAKAAAKSLGLPLQLQLYTTEDVEQVLPKVLWLIEEPDLMKASIAVPFFWAAEVAAEHECHVLLAGQGADELFGGYHRYLEEYRRGGAKSMHHTMFRDVERSYEVNFQRDNPVCAFHGVDLRLPFMDREVVNFALSLPVNLKIKSSTDALRKRVLRQVAQNLGIPNFVANRTKKAIQFATGVDKAIRKLAKKERLTPRNYIRQIFRELYPTLEVLS